MQTVSAGLGDLSPARYDFGAARIARVTTWPAQDCPGVIELMTVHGVITPGTWGRIAERAALIERRDQTVAAVTIFESAVFALTGDEMHAAEMRQVRAGLLLNPRAFVVSPNDLSTLRRYQCLMASQGIGRFAFSGVQMEQALHWAQETGRLMSLAR